MRLTVAIGGFSSPQRLATISTGGLASSSYGLASSSFVSSLVFAIVVLSRTQIAPKQREVPVKVW